MAPTQYFKLFSDQAAKYAVFRPTYPAALYERIYSFAEPFERKLALDLGTGQGQAALVLSKSFEKVIGMDANVSQLQHATHAPNVEFREGDAHHTGLPSSSVNLITVAQAFHWFDHDKIYKEMRRILTPDGCFAAWGYDVLMFKNNPEATKVVRVLYEDTLGPFWADRRTIVDAHYKTILPTMEDFKVIEHVETEMTHTMNVEALVGYITTWSAYNTYCKQGGDGEKLLQRFHDDLVNLLGLQSGTDDVEVTHPVFVILAKQPQPVEE